MHTRAQTRSTLPAVCALSNVVGPKSISKLSKLKVEHQMAPKEPARLSNGEEEETSESHASSSKNNNEKQNERSAPAHVGDYDASPASHGVLSTLPVTHIAEMATGSCDDVVTADSDPYGFRTATVAQRSSPELFLHRLDRRVVTDQDRYQLRARPFVFGKDHVPTPPNTP